MCYLLLLSQKATILYPLRSTCFHRFPYYYEVIRLLTRHLRRLRTVKHLNVHTIGMGVIHLGPCQLSQVHV
jgi:hypothetical protein